MFGSNNSQESFAKVLENNLSYYLSPLLMGAKNAIIYCYEQFPFLSMIGTGFALILGYVGINRFKAKTRNERKSEKERRLSEIPRISTDMAAVRRDIQAFNGSNYLTLQREQSEKIDTLHRDLANHAQTLSGVERKTSAIAKTVAVLPAYGDRLTTIEGLQRSGNQKVDEVGGYVRLRQNPNN